MSKRLVSLLVAGILSFGAVVTADVVLDDFANTYANEPTQSFIGEAYGYSMNPDSADKGGGWWSPFCDDQGSVVLNSAGVAVTDASGNGVNDDVALNGMVDTTNKSLSLVFKTNASKELYPYAGVSCDIMGSETQTFDFTNMSAVKLILRSTGTVRFVFQTTDFDSLPADDQWGYYGFDFKSKDTTKALSETAWDTLTVTFDQISPEKDSPAATKGMMWRYPPSDTSGRVDGCKGTLSFGIEVNRTKTKDDKTLDTTAVLADVALEIGSIVFVGMDYKTVFGFDLPDIGIVSKAYTPLEKSLFNVTSGVNNDINLSYNLKSRSNVSMAVYDLAGKKIFESTEKSLAAGNYSENISLDGKTLSSGVYVAKLKVNGIASNRNFTLVK